MQIDFRRVATVEGHGDFNPDEYAHLETRPTTPEGIRVKLKNLGYF